MKLKIGAKTSSSIPPDSLDLFGFPENTNIDSLVSKPAGFNVLCAVASSRKITTPVAFKLMSFNSSEINRRLANNPYIAPSVAVALFDCLDSATSDAALKNPRTPKSLVEVFSDGDGLSFDKRELLDLNSQRVYVFLLSKNVLNSDETLAVLKLCKYDALRSALLYCPSYREEILGLLSRF